MNKPLRKNQKVAYVNRGGEWKIVGKHAPDKIFMGCQRYDITNGEETLLQVRDKDLIPKGGKFYNDFVNIVEV
jgi:hypothetical protein